MNVIVFGGDGFIGWPLSLRLKSLGHNVVVVDDFSRRTFDECFETNSLTDIESPEMRSTISGISFEKISIDTEFEKIKSLFERFKPNVCVHLAQQRSAPVSMYSPTTGMLTVTRNNGATVNILEAIKRVSPQTKLVHMGTMGVYGYSDSKIGEGYEGETLAPMNPGSLYHLTKCHDQLTFQFYKKMYDLKIVDLHQGIVWGSQTKETTSHPALTNRFDYDSMYGTVLNRFICQRAKKTQLTVYGGGGQTRSFIHIEDSISACVNAIEKDFDDKNVLIANQFTEIFSVLELALMVGGEISHLKNPRKELENKDYQVQNEAWKTKFGNVSTTITKDNIEKEFLVAEQSIHNYKEKNTEPISFW